VALGFTNLLPIPALDGGRLILLLPEIFLRKKVPAKVENVINMVGFAALLALMVIITTMDIINPVVMP
jgi:regulator of sigma E protease